MTALGTMSPLSMWLVVIGMGLITFGLRLGSLVLGSRLPQTEALRDFLRFVPIAVLSAIIAIELLAPQGYAELSLATLPRLAGGLVSIVIAWRTRKVLPAVLGGMAIFWLVQAVV
jgi:branched-subunit amino acid transport protein